MMDELAGKTLISNEKYVRDVLPLVQERARTLTEVAELTQFFFTDELEYEAKLKTGQLFGTLRVATTGRTAAPPLFQTMAVLGKERCLRRIEAALDKLHKLSPDN